MQVERAVLFRPGDVFRGYTVVRLLGSGGLGEVYLVRHEMLDVLYALKVLHPDVAERNPEYVRRFLREAKLSTRIRHINLVGVHDCGRDAEKNLYYLVMDYVEGGTLRNALAFCGRFEPAKAADVIFQLAGALEAARPFHMVHRDIKPENIMLQPDGTVKLVDLGIAKADSLGDSIQTKTNTVFGTPMYVAPEQAMNAADVDERADIYSLGIVFFEMLTGQPPYRGGAGQQLFLQVLSDDPLPDVRTVVPDMPASVSVLVDRMCRKKREERIGSCSELKGELTRLGFPLKAPDASSVEYTPTGADERSSSALKIDLDKLPPNNPTLSFETQDETIRAFVGSLKRRRRRKRLIICAVFALLILWALCWTVR